ncbi:GNAT family N-acetyltransferase [Kitasatospora sp. KL5]|uniref:GNAT family N-acetyltransferase n=1 Tax=Kitasatospora sp. KL5 TaxID=3425125 RepID=UPI003D6EEDF8
MACPAGDPRRAQPRRRARRPAGTVGGIPAAEPGGVELVSMWVDPAARGRGVADALIRAVEQWAIAGGARTLRLSVMRGNAAAAALYERHGFTGTGEPGDLLPGGVRRERVPARRLPTA